MKILGIDPGLRKTGWGIVVWKNNSFSYINDGFFFQAEDGIRDCLLSRGLGDVYKRQLRYHGYLKII